MVRLITHNLLACHVKGCTSNNFPLAFKDVQIELREAEFNSDFVKGFLPKLEWTALVGAARQASPKVIPRSYRIATTLPQLGDTSLPEKMPDAEIDEALLKSLHHVLLEVCPILPFPSQLLASRKGLRYMWKMDRWYVRTAHIYIPYRMESRIWYASSPHQFTVNKK